MTKLYVYTTVEGFEGSWDEALEQGKVEIVATIEGEGQKAVEKKAHELYGDSDTYGWTYSDDGFDYTEEVEEIRLAGDEEDEQVEAQDAGATWMETVLTECENPEEWLGLNYQEFLQAAANATRPAFPAFETTEETDEAYRGAWDQLGLGMKLHAEDKVYQNMVQQEQENAGYSERHEGISAFFSFLRDSLKDPSVLDSEAGRKEWVKDLETALATTGGNDYKIPARLTKSGNAELYTITREWFTTPDGEEDYLIVH